ncbi:MAG: OmpA family protein [Draconibacterium sp.]
MATDKLTELREILVRLDEDQLLYLKSLLTNEDLLVNEVAKILPQSLFQSINKSDQIQTELIPVIESVIFETIENKPEQISEVLAPFMGKTIRNAIQYELNKLFQSLNNIVDQTLTLRGLKWRYISLVTGKPYSEIAMLKTFGYQIKHVILIHNETGLLLQEVNKTKLLKDPDLVSSMLTAIKNFVEESISGKLDQNLNSIKVGENQIWIETQSKISLACVIEGYPPESYRDLMIETLETLQKKFSTPITYFSGDSSVFGACSPYLQKCLNYAEEKKSLLEPKKISFSKFFLFILLTVFLFFYIRFGISQFRYHKFIRTLSHTEGIFVTNKSIDWGNIYIKGIRKFNSPTPVSIAIKHNIDTTKLKMNWELIEFTDESILEKNLVSGLVLPNSFSATIKHQKIVLRGSISDSAYSQLINRIETDFSNFDVEKENLNIVPTSKLNSLIYSIEEKQVYFHFSSDSLTESSKAQLLLLTSQIPELDSLCKIFCKDYKIEVIGHSDNSGSEVFNRAISAKRALKVQEMLLTSGVNENNIFVKNMGTTSTQKENIPASKKRRVNLKIVVI